MRVAAAFLLAGIAMSASAQTGTYTWELSTDGVTWSSLIFVPGGTLIHARLLASWSGVTGTDLGYAGGQFDAVLFGGTAASTVSNIQRPAPFAFAAQTLVSSTYAGGIKIDTSADVAAPGAGTGWVNPGQSAKDFAAAGNYNSSNPAVVFSYDVIAGEDLIFSMVLNQTSGRAMAVYTNSGGTQLRMSASAITITNARITPTPGGLSLLCLSGIVAARRRR